MNATGLYIHWPYCSAICPYCDFNVYRQRGADGADLVDAIAKDIAGHAQRFGKRELTSIFFGGGTPSLLEAKHIAQLIDATSRSFDLASDCEVTLEANPEDASRFADQAAAGVTRFSVGIQALDDASLRALGRKHDARAARHAVEAAAATGKRVSCDLIYAREGQGMAAWRTELSEALALPVEHVSLYQLTIESGTAFARRVERGALAPPGDDAAAALYEATQEICDAAGFAAYEISNHARTPDAQSRHNQLYWRSQDWIGVGPGAHGRITHGEQRLAQEAHLTPRDYVDAVREHGIGWLTEATLTAEEAGDEMLLMGVRTAEGVDIADIDSVRGRPLNRDALAWLEDQALVTRDGDRLRLTAQGKLLCNRIVAELAS